MTLDRKAIETLSAVSTATITTILLKKGLRNIWIRGARALRPGSPSGSASARIAAGEGANRDGSKNR